MPFPQLLFFNEAGYNAAVADVTARGQRLQALVTAYGLIPGAPALVAADLADLVSDPRELVWRKVNNGEPVTVGGFAISPARAMAMIDWPVQVEDLVQLQQQTVSTAAHQRIAPDFYTLTAGAVTIKPATLTTLAERFNYYARNQKALDYWNALTAVADALNGLAALHCQGQSGSVEDLLIKPYLHFATGRYGNGSNLSAAPGQVTVNVDAVSRF